jgi:hypothetical protein
MNSGTNGVQEPIAFGNGAVIGTRIRVATQTTMRMDGGESTWVGSKGDIEMV